jgi:hypothetical protein
MKHLLIILLLLLLFNCRNNNPNKTLDAIEETEELKPLVIDTLQIDTLKISNPDITPINKAISIELKQKTLIKKQDERDQLQKLIIDKKYIKDTKDYTIDFNYPLLNESFKPTNKNFNEFINEYYVNITKTESEILESKLLCDSIEAKNFREERLIDYKIYNVNDELVSVLFYKENFYTGAMHPSYSFDCFNFDLNRGVFMTYEDFFIVGSEDEFLAIINKKIDEKIQGGNLYYECWELSLDDFIISKNNFVLNETYVEFYFDDCIICPSYTGTYSIQLPLLDLLSVLKKYDLNPLVF